MRKQNACQKHKVFENRPSLLANGFLEVDGKAEDICSMGIDTKIYGA
tara:strand:- start:95 stop:235 length:141 start_codon:yes stop_codon:yes gene_type:complete